MNHSPESVARRVTLRYQPPSRNLREELSRSSFVAFLRKAHEGEIEPGDEWEHFVSRGCGSPQNVRLEVQSLHGGDEVGDTTEFDFVPAINTDELERSPPEEAERRESDRRKRRVQ